MDACSLWVPRKIYLAQAIQAGNFVGWPLLTVANVKKYYPETTETPKGHMNQTRKNVRSTKLSAKHQPFEEADTKMLRGQKNKNNNNNNFTRYHYGYMRATHSIETKLICFFF